MDDPMSRLEVVTRDIERAADALLVEEEAVAQNGPGIVRAQGLVRAGP
jgi:hypothetical protein